MQGEVAHASNGQAPPAPGGALEVADDLARAFAETAVERDKRGGTPKEERDRLRRSGLLSLSVLASLGGWGAPWTVVLEAVRRIARADSAVAHVFGFHHLMLATLRLFGSADQASRLQAATVAERWFWGNALNPLDTRARLVRRGDGLAVRGAKSFCSGASDSDMLIVSALDDATSKLVVAAIPTRRPGIRVLDDWDNMGQRQTDSGTVELDDVEVRADELLTTPGPLGSPFASLRPCLAQLVLVNVYLGLAEGAFEEARRYTSTRRRPWIAAKGTPATEDPYVLLRYGDLWLALEGARLLADRAAAAFQAAWEQGDRLSPEQRGGCAIAVAAAKVATSRAGLEITNGMFEVMGASATAASAGMDRFWRNLRTHTLHDPVDYKSRELGAYALNGAIPEPSFYS
ncbi:acyl-CoA dehydrogenase family protein [Sorangium cellulosum]|uniref:Dibenzothiophene monooxygenase n=1 Tax=Sorangium cellulosum TaxID=56 RepID=A0A4P2QM57_SORCE|nr:monooxygenase [Sorangium cellulosum]WCQ90279.1 putative FMNH2-dependent monooxygenase SfnC [Sorangium sp. Soce836]